jgi:hypothetical protein
MLNSLTYGPLTSGLIVHRADGSTEGADPQHVVPSKLIAAGHVPQPILKVIRAKCLDCSGGSRSEAAACTAVGCALWPYRLGANPFAKPRGRSFIGPGGSSEKVPQTAGVSGGARLPNPDRGATSGKGGAS